MFVSGTGAGLFAAVSGFSGLQELCELAYGPPAVRYGVLLVGRHLGERAVEPVGYEEGVVTEALATRFVVGDMPLDNPFEQILAAFEQQRDNGAETCAAVGRTLQVFQQQAVVGCKIVAVGGIAGRVYARGAAKGLDLKSGIVGEAVAAVRSCR